MNKSFIIVALVIALGLVAYGWSPRYTMTNIGDGRVVRLDRWTGNVLLCGNWSGEALSCSDAVKTAEVWRDATPEEMAQASAANQADEDAKSAASSARRAGEEAAQAASNTAKEAADAAEAAMRH